MAEVPKNIRQIALDLANQLIEHEFGYPDRLEMEANFLKTLFPQGIPPQKYKAAMHIARIMGRVYELAKVDGDMERIYRDIASYGLLGTIMEEKP